MKFLKLFQKQEKILNEMELLVAYQRTGNLRLVGELYQPYMQMVFAICFKYLKDEDESKDAVMNIFEKLITDLRNHDVRNFKTWLNSVTRNHCLMLIRSQKAFVAHSEMADTDNINLISEVTDSSDSLQLDENLSTMEKCLEALVDEQKVSINMFYIQEKCYRQISEETGFDFIKVKSYIQNGKRNLKICMEKNGVR